MCFSRYCQCAWRRKTSFPTSPMCSRTQTWLSAWLSVTTLPVLRSCLPESSTPSLLQGTTPRLPRWQPMHPRYSQCATKHPELGQTKWPHSQFNYYKLRLCKLSRLLRLSITINTQNLLDVCKTNLDLHRNSLKAKFSRLYLDSRIWQSDIKWGLNLSLVEIIFFFFFCTFFVLLWSENLTF